MTSYTRKFGGSTLSPSEYSYSAITLSSSITLSWPIDSTPGGVIVPHIADVSCAIAGLQIKMPDATYVSPGAAVLFNGVGSALFIVTDSGGSTLLTVQPGTTWMLYLTGNATSAGVWRAFQFGAAASAANAASMAGMGLRAIGSTLNQSVPVSQVLGTVSSSLAHRASLLVWAANAGSYLLMSPVDAGPDFFVYLRNSGGSTVTVNPTAGVLIDGIATVTLQPGDACAVVCDGNSYYTIGRGPQFTGTFSFLAIDISGSGNYTLSSAEQNKMGYRFTGTLTGAREIIVPLTVQQYWVDNSTSGPYQVSIRTAPQASPGVIVVSGTRVIAYCDGNNVVQADTSSVSLPIPVSSGGTGAVNSSSALTNLGGTTVGKSVFTAASAAAARSAIGAAAIDDATAIAIALST